jgi:hypothetical protein
MRTRWPRDASQNAADDPAGPAPTTRTSYRSRSADVDMVGIVAHRTSERRTATPGGTPVTDLSRMGTG